MKILEIIKNLDRTNKDLVENSPNWPDISNVLGVQLDWSEDKRLKSYYVAPHYCTDSYVGMRAYFLDDEFIAISNQEGRKCDEYFEFVSKEVMVKTRNYLLSLIEPNYFDPPLIDTEKDIGSTYDVEYSSQLLLQFHRFAIYKSTGEKVEIIGATNDYSKNLIKIKFEDGRTKIDNVRNLGFEYGKVYDFVKIEKL